MKKNVLAAAILLIALIGITDVEAAFPPVVMASWKSNFRKVEIVEAAEIEAAAETVEDIEEGPEETEDPATPTDIGIQDEGEAGDAGDAGDGSDEVVNFTSTPDADSVVSDTTSYDEISATPDADSVVSDTTSYDEGLIEEQTVDLDAVEDEKTDINDAVTDTGQIDETTEELVNDTST